MHGVLHQIFTKLKLFSKYFLTHNIEEGIFVANKMTHFTDTMLDCMSQLGTYIFSNRVSVINVTSCVGFSDLLNQM